MADPTLYGYKIIKGAAAASQTIDLTTLLDPSGAALGPALGGQFTVVHIIVGHTTNRNPAATGYTVVMDGYATDTQGTALWVGHKFQPSTPDTSITITASGSSGSSLIAIATVWDNVDPTTPLDGVATVNLSTANTALPNPGSITPTTTGAVILFGAGNSHNAGVTAISESYMDWSVEDSRDGTNDASALVGYVSGGVAATPYDGAALTWAGTDGVTLSNCSNVMVLRPAPAGGVSVTPSTGVVSVAGLAPSVAAGVAVTPSAGAVAVAGFAPTAAAGVVAVPDAGAVSVAGFAPSAAAGVAVTPDAGAVTITGFAPTVSAGSGVSVTPDAGVVSVAGFAPSVAAGVTVTPSLGVVSVAGFAPTVSIGTGVSVTPDTGAISVVGFAPTVAAGVAVVPGVGAVTVTGFAPDVSVIDAVTFRRGDDAGSRERFWAGKSEEWLKAKVSRIEAVSRKPRRARVRFAEAFLEAIDDHALPEARVDALTSLIADLTAPAPDYTALAMAAREWLDRIAREKRQWRDSRDVRALIALGAI